MTVQDLLAVLFLVVMEGLLSFDNALALAAMVRHLPGHRQKQALWWGMGGAFIFRFLSLWCISWLMESVWVKAIGGGYLLVMALRYFYTEKDNETQNAWVCVNSFLMTVISVELTDLVFSVDSILAAVAVSPKLWVIVAGGIAGIVMMRLAAVAFIRLMERFPGLERSAFVLVGIVGAKLISEACGVRFEGWLFVTFWVAMGTALLSGFVEVKVVE